MTHTRLRNRCSDNFFGSSESHQSKTTGVYFARSFKEEKVGVTHPVDVLPGRQKKEVPMKFG